MKTIICGSRHFSDYDLMIARLCVYRHSHEISEVVSGCAPGADTLGERWATERGILVRRFPAEWKTYGRAAGPIRNRAMAEYAEACIAFLYEGSRGTKNMIEQATKKGLRVHVIHCDKPDPWSVFDERS